MTFTGLNEILTTENEDLQPIPDGFSVVAALPTQMTVTQITETVEEQKPSMKLFVIVNFLMKFFCHDMAYVFF